jgi:hypothetical protein
VKLLFAEGALRRQGMLIAPCDERSSGPLALGGNVRSIPRCTVGFVLARGGDFWYGLKLDSYALRVCCRGIKRQSVLTLPIMQPTPPVFLLLARVAICGAISVVFADTAHAQPQLVRTFLPGPSGGVARDVNAS